MITIPAEPASTDDLPPALKPFCAVPPLVTDINLSVDDKFLYVSCWGTGELKQYDVSDPLHPRQAGSVRLGGIAARVPHPAAPRERPAGGPQMVEVSRHGERIYLTNSPARQLPPGSPTATPRGGLRAGAARRRGWRPAVPDAPEPPAPGYTKNELARDLGLRPGAPAVARAAAAYRDAFTSSFWHEAGRTARDHART